MSLITINGAELLAPTEFTVTLFDLSRNERNANGTTIIERIATKRRIDMSWSYMTKAQLQTILNQVSPVFVTLVYPDPQTGADRTGTFFLSDRSAGMIDVIGGVPRYKDVSFTFTER